MPKIQKLHFQPIFGLSSKHIQTILPTYLSSGVAPFSEDWIVELEEKDFLSCKISTPANWTSFDPTIILIHGLGGSHTSDYMIRMARKAYQKGYRVIRVNLRGAGSGLGLSKLPYYAGCSHDILKIILKYKQESPNSLVTLIGFSLGGNILLKLMGELGDSASALIHRCFAICSPLDLAQTVEAIGKRRHHIYQAYYLKKIFKQMHFWMKAQPKTLFEVDDKTTGPLWGFPGANEYYEKCSSMHFLPKIRCTTHLLLTEDDPFIDYTKIKELVLDESVNIWTTKHGGHMGFLGQTPHKEDFFWMDYLLLNWLDNNFKIKS